MLEKWLIIVAMVVLSFGMGHLHGCSSAQQEIKLAETRFIERVKVVTEIERVEVPKYIRSIQVIDNTRDALIVEAKNETPNPTVCDLSDERVFRIRKAATARSE